MTRPQVAISIDQDTVDDACCHRTIKGRKTLAHFFTFNMALDASQQSEMPNVRVFSRNNYKSSDDPPSRDEMYMYILSQ